MQVDHRVPYEIGGEQDEEDLDCFMLLSPSANRAKSWTCEHCANWDIKDAEFCLSCFWAHPEKYNHVAGRLEKVVSIIFSGNEIDDYNKLIELAGEETAQERDRGELSRTTDISSAIQTQGAVAAEASAKLKLDIPLVSRISFLFTGKIEAYFNLYHL